MGCEVPGGSWPERGVRVGGQIGRRWREPRAWLAHLMDKYTQKPESKTQGRGGGTRLRLTSDTTWKKRNRFQEENNQSEVDLPWDKAHRAGQKETPVPGMRCAALASWAGPACSDQGHVWSLTRGRYIKRCKEANSAGARPDFPGTSVPGGPGRRCSAEKRRFLSGEGSGGVRTSAPCAPNLMISQGGNAQRGPDVGCPQR